MTTVFICIDWFHPAYKAGGPVQSVANLVQQYGHVAVNFKIFCANTDLDGMVNQGVAFDEWVNFNEHTQVWYASKNKRLAMLQQARLLKPDVLFIIGVYSLYFNLLPLLFSKARRKIISARGMLHPGALTQKPLQKKIYLAFWKAIGVHRNNFFHATDVVEAGFIRQVFGAKANVFIAGNFSKKIALQVVADKKAGEIKLLSIALISAMKNIDLVLDALKSCRHSICYQIYGPIKDEAYWLLCLSKIKQLPLNVKVIYKGAITPLQIEAKLLTSAVFILPSKSENFGHAIFEALSAGKPVITSHYTPFNKLAENYAGKNVSVENSLEMTAAIDSFAAMGQAEFAQWNIGAYQYANAYSDDALLQQQYDSMFLNTAAFV